MSDEIKYKRVTNIELARFNKMYGNVIRINRHDYRIVWCRDLNHNGPCAGLCDVANKEIYVDVSTDIEETLIHETSHAEVFEAGFRQRNDWDMNLEEMLVETMAKGVSSAFKIRKKV